MKAVIALCLALGLLGHALCLAQAALPPQKLDLLKRGTVFVRLPGVSRSGTGFIVAVQDDTVFAATNAHVVAPGRSGDGPRIEVLVDPGTPTPRSATARVVAFDETADLAIVAFRLADPPPVLPLARSADVPETTPVYVLGFPFGEALAEPNVTPAVTVARASISALRRGQDGVVERLQLDGELNPGNSGGPIVNDDGEVLGVAVAKVGGTNISFVIPVTFLQGCVRGRVRTINLRPVPGAAGAREIEATVELLDPLDRVSAAAIVTAPKSQQRDADPGKPGEFKPLVGASEHPLTLEKDTARGRVKLARTGAAGEAELFQVKLVRKDGQTTYTAPGEFPGSHDEEAAGNPEAAEDFGKPAGRLEAEKVVKLPAEVERLEVAGGGRYLVMKLRDMPALSVFDTFKGELAKHIRLPSTEFIFAAGGNTAVVYLRAENLLQSYDLDSFERKKTKSNPFGPVITDIVMGHSRGGRALVRHAVGTEQLSQVSFSLLDTVRLEPIKLAGRDGRPPISPHHSSYRDQVHFRANRDMDMITEWATGQSPTGVGLLVRHGSTYEQRYEHNSDGYLAIGDDGRVYTESGRIYNSRLEEFGNLQGMKLFPALGGTLYLALAPDGKLTVYEAGKTRPLGPIGEFPAWKTNEGPHKQGDELGLDRRVIFLPVHGRIAFIPQDNKTVILRPFDLKGALVSAGVDYLIVMSTPTAPATIGKSWTYQIETISRAGGVSFSLELDPEGMHVSDAGLVTWTPKELPSGEGDTVVILVKDRSGEETYHKFMVTVLAE
jgi:hypothetical protein